MLPSRPRLESWNPDSLTFTGSAIRDAGRTVADAVTTLSTNIKEMPDTRAWSGSAHDAAEAMFERAGRQADSFSDYTTAVGDAFTTGAGTIGGARTALLDKADQIDMGGQLHVSDQWVVLITGAQMTLEEAAALEKRAQAEQVVVNGLLLKVGAADDDTAAAVTAAATPHGFVAPNPSDPASLLLPGTQRPGDEVPNPSTAMGMLQQGMLRDADMSQTVRETTTETKHDPATGELISTTTTMYMQDGSRHERTADAKPLFSDRGPATTETHYDEHGNVISESSTVTFNDRGDHSMDNATVTSVKMADGTLVTLVERPGGSRSGTVTTPNGQTADIPREFFDKPLMTGVETAIAGLEHTPHGIPKLSAEAVEHIRAGAKYAGPGLGIATTLWEVAVADSGFARCVAATEGATGLATGALAGLATSEMGPVAIPIAILAGEGGSQLGNWIGNTFCPR